MEVRQAGVHIIIDLVTNDVDKINNVQSFYDYMEKVTDISDMVMIAHPQVMRFPWSGEYKRLANKLKKEGVQSKVLEDALEDLRAREEEKSGCTMFTVWADSHASGHSWPEYQGLALDLFSCKEFDEDAVVSFIQEWFSAERMDVLTVERFFGKAQEIRSYTLFN